MSAREIIEFEIDKIGYICIRNISDKNKYSLPIRLIYKNPKKQLTMKSFKTIDEVDSFLCEEAIKFNIDVSLISGFYKIEDDSIEYRVVDRKNKIAYNITTEEKQDKDCYQLKTEKIENYSFSGIKVLDENILNNKNQNIYIEK